MTTTDILTDMVLVESKKTATIHAPVERVDIADWLLHLPDAEYQRCARRIISPPQQQRPPTAGRRLREERGDDLSNARLPRIALPRDHRNNCARGAAIRPVRPHYCLIRPL